VSAIAQFRSKPLPERHSQGRASLEKRTAEALLNKGITGKLRIATKGVEQAQLVGSDRREATGRGVRSSAARLPAQLSAEGWKPLAVQLKSLQNQG